YASKSYLGAALLPSTREATPANLILSLLYSRVLGKLRQQRIIAKEDKYINYAENLQCKMNFPLLQGF
ncbi:MAG TPA: hypothetical protein VJ455_01810, partial [Ignavibacteria bacterium]|nr:hypothetical protein [Ignavibacteria bacterium]